MATRESERSASTQSLIDLENQYGAHNYHPLDVVIERAEGVWVYDVHADRTVSDRRLFAKVPEGIPDGMTVDAEGCVWAAIVMGPGEIVRFKRDGTVDRRVKVPAKSVTSVAFGGPDMRDLYAVTANNTNDRALKGSVFRTRSDVPGLPVPKARF